MNSMVLAHLYCLTKAAGWLLQKVTDKVDLVFGGIQSGERKQLAT